MFDITQSQATILVAIIAALAPFSAYVIESLKNRARAKDEVKESEKNQLAIIEKINILENRLEELSSNKSSANLDLNQTISPSSILNDQQFGKTTVKNSDDAQIFFDDWNEIKNFLENLAQDENLDGRSRAALARLNRQQYPVFITALRRYYERKTDFDAVVAAYDLWAKFRNRRNIPRHLDVLQMARYKEKILVS